MKSFQNCLLALSIFSSSALLAGEHKTHGACQEVGAQGKAQVEAKTKEDCSKLGEKFQWVEASASTEASQPEKVKKSAKKAKQQAKSESTEKTMVPTEDKANTPSSPETEKK